MNENREAKAEQEKPFLKPSTARALTLLAIGLAIVAGIWILNIQGTGEGPTPPSIRTPNDYEAAKQDATVRSEASLEKYDAGGSLSEKEKKDILQAAKDFEAMFGFDPNKFEYAFAAGKIYYILGDDVNADKWLVACIETRPADRPPEEDNPLSFYVQTLAEAHYIRSEIFFRHRNYAEAYEAAQTASEAVPMSAVYVAQEAEAQLQMGNPNAAKYYVQKALKIDPRNAKAKNLEQFLSGGSR